MDKLKFIMRLSGVSLIPFLILALSMMASGQWLGGSRQRDKGKTTTTTTTESWHNRGGGDNPPSNIQFVPDPVFSGNRMTTRRSDRYAPPTTEMYPLYSTSTTARPDYGWSYSTIHPRVVDYGPSVNFSALDSSDKFINISWVEDHGRNPNLELDNRQMEYIDKVASILVRPLRRIQILIVCNATSPIEWVSRQRYGTDDWELDEYRYFHPRGDIIYSLILKLNYDKGRNEAMPNLELICGELRNPGNIGSPRQTHLDFKTSSDSDILLARVYRNRKKLGEGDDWSNIHDLDELEYTEELGANIKCNLHLSYSPLGKFVCVADSVDDEDERIRKNSNLTIDYKECSDFATCRRKFQPRRCIGVKDGGKEREVAPSYLWQQKSPPPAGIIYCKVEGSKNWNESSARPFFHSLPALCPQDQVQTRRQLYVGSQVRIDLNDLERDFVSFCLTSETGVKSDDGNIPSNDFSLATKYVLYAGENLTVSCLSSIYHFAEGTRIKFFDGISDSYAKVITADTQQLHGVGRGYYNYTAKVHVRSKDIRGIVCENYLKRSKDSVKKFLRIEVKTPRNITFLGGLPSLAKYNYSGQTGFHLKCEADGDPMPKIRWKKQGKPIPTVIEEVDGHNWSILKFPSREEQRFNVEDLHGTYSCEAYNKLDLAEKLYLVEIINSTDGDKVILVDTSGNVVQQQDTSGGEGGGEGFNVWAVVVPVLLVLALAIIAFLVWKVKMQRKELRALTKAEVHEFIFGKPEMLQHHCSSEEVNNYAPYLPYNKAYEIGKDQLELDENALLGSGAYAVVLKGTLNIKGGDNLKVAIKTAKPMDDMSFFKALLSELKIMGFIGTHPNIVNLVGAHTKNIQNREVFIAIEYCGNGNVLNFLRENRQGIRNLVGPNGDILEELLNRESYTHLGKEELSTLTLLRWALEVATGMEFLSGKKVIHGDLAARNILLNENLVAKIGDFGLSRQLFEYTNYIKKQQSPLPWKWLAIECLQDMRFSVKSDVWAYGILLFEFFSLGQVPYPGYSYNDEFLDALIQGKRPNRPAFASKEVYALMQACWKEKSEERPSFTGIKEYFSGALGKLVPQEYLDLHEKVMSNATPSIHSRQSNESNSEMKVETNGEDTQQRQSRFSLNMKTISAAFHRH